jgi:hypothetical protein
VDSWVRLTLPERRFRFVAVSTVWVGRDEEIRPEAAYAPAARVVTVRNTRGCIERPWRMKPDLLSGKKYYFLEFSESPKVFTIENDRLVYLESDAVASGRRAINDRLLL